MQSFLYLCIKRPSKIASPITPDIKEYEIADRAFQLAVLFAQTMFISQHGYKPNGDELGRLLRDIEYDYKKEG